MYLFVFFLILFAKFEWAFDGCILTRKVFPIFSREVKHTSQETILPYNKNEFPIGSQSVKNVKHE